jgi:hypothetical protein
MGDADDIHIISGQRFRYPSDLGNPKVAGLATVQVPEIVIDAVV